mgnify:CR=1 FL=1
MTMDQIRALVKSAPADDKTQDRILKDGTKVHNCTRNIQASVKGVVDANFIEGCRTSHYRAQFK